MKRVKRLLLIAASVAFVVFLSGFADKENNAAMIINENGGCGLYDFDFNESYYGTLFSVTNHGGNSTLICKSKDMIGTGVKREWSGFPCGTYLGYTENSNFVISADGKATLRCQVKKPKK